MNAEERPRRRWIARSARALVGVVLAAAGLTALLFGLLHLAAVQQATARVATREAARILECSVDAGAVRWNLLAGTLELTDVSLRGVGERAGTEITVPRARARVWVGALLRGRVVVESVVLEKPAARLALDGGGRLLLPFRIPPSPDEEPTARPDVGIRELHLVGGALELTERGEAARRIDVKGIDLEGNLGLRELESTGSLTLGAIDVSSAGHEPLRGTSLAATWKTRGESATVTARLAAREAGLEAALDGEVRDLWTTPRYAATVTASGSLGPLAERLAPELELRGSIEARVALSGTGTEPPTATATVGAEALTLLGRTFERVDFAGNVAGGLLRNGTLDLAAGPGRLHAEADGTVYPEPKGLRFSLRAERVDLARLLALPAGAPRLAGRLDGTVAGTLARPAYEGITASADLAVTGSGAIARNAVPLTARARLRLAGGRLTADSVELAEPGTKAALNGLYDHRGRRFEGRVDVESRNVGPWLALFGLQGKGELSAHVRGGGLLARPVLEGRLRARDLTVGDALVDCVELDATSNGTRFTASNASVSAYGVTANAQAEGELPLPGVKSPEIDVHVRGVRFRGQPLGDGSAHLKIGATLEARVGTVDGRIWGKVVLPARGGFQAEATLDRFRLDVFAALLPSHLADLRGEATGRLEASQAPSGPLVAKLSVAEGFVAAAGRRISTSGAEASVRGERVDVAGLELKGDDGSFVSVSGRGNLDGREVDAHLRMDVPDLSAYTLLLPPVQEGATAISLAGSLSADVRIAGDLRRPGVSGTLRARDLAGFGGALSRLDATLNPDGEGRSTASLAIEGLSWGAYRIEDVQADARLEGAELSAEGRASGGRLRLKATGSLEGARPFDATATLDALDLGPFLRAAGGPASVGAVASGRVRVRGTGAEPGDASVDVELDSFETTHSKWSVRADGPVKLGVDRRRLDVRSLRLSGTGLTLEATGGLPFDGSGGDVVTLESSLDLAVLLPFVDVLDRASGRAVTHLEIGGSLSRPVPTGSLTLEGALFDGPDFPTPVEKVTGTIVAKRGEVRTDGLSARLGGGSVLVAGALGLAEGRPVRVDASLRARDIDLEAGKDLQVRLGGDVTAKGAWSSVLVAGEVRVEEATYVPALDLTGLLKALKARRHTAAAAAKAERSPFVPDVSLDVAVLAKDAIHVEGNLGDAELGGTLRVKGTPAAPVVLGTVSSTRGTIYLLGSTFDVSRCHLEFSDPLAIDPELDVVATTTKNDEEITIRVDGRASNAQLFLSSTKGRSQADIVSVLLGGSGTGGSSELTVAAARMAMRGAVTPVLGALGAHTDLEIVPLPTTPEGEEFLFSVGKDLGGGISATYYKGVSGETTDALEMKWRISSRARGRLRQNQDGSISGGFRIRRDLD